MNILIDRIVTSPRESVPMQTITLAGIPRVGEFVVIDDYVLEVVEVQWVSNEDYAAMLRVRPA